MNNNKYTNNNINSTPLFAVFARLSWFYIGNLYKSFMWSPPALKRANRQNKRVNYKNSTGQMVLKVIFNLNSALGITNKCILFPHRVFWGYGITPSKRGVQKLPRKLLKSGLCKHGFYTKKVVFNCWIKWRDELMGST